MLVPEQRKKNKLKFIRVVGLPKVNLLFFPVLTLVRAEHHFYDPSIMINIHLTKNKKAGKGDRNHNFVASFFFADHF